MAKLAVLFIIITFMSCKNENKNHELDQDKGHAKISSSNKLTKINNSALKIVEPVKWTTKTKRISETDYELIIVANIEQGYHLYSQKVPTNGPLPTVFIFEESDDYDLIGTTFEEEGHLVHDHTFDMEIKSFKTRATFKQLIKLNRKKSKIMAEMEFMSCNDAQCLNGYSDIEFAF